MSNAWMKSLSLAALSAVAAAGLTSAQAQRAAAAETPAGTAITNQATAKYSDPNGLSYTTSSNIVTTIVQNAPTMTVTTNNATPTNPGNAITATSVPGVPGATITDTYTLTNTGNGSGAFTAQTGSGVTGGLATSSSLYVVTLPSGSTLTLASACTATPLTTVALLNTCLATFTGTNAVGTTATTNALNVAVVYTVSQGAVATATTNVQTALIATITYPASGSLAAATSANATNTYTDPITPDARLDLQKTSAQDPVSGNITYTVLANNGGSNATHYSAAGAAFAGMPANALVAIVDKIPQFPPALPVPLAIVGTPTVKIATGALYGATAPAAQIWYSTSATVGSGWTNVQPTGTPVYWIAVVISGGTSPVGTGSCAVVAQPCGLVSNPGSSAGNAGTTPQVTLNFVIAQPTGSGSANTGSVKNVANSVTGTNSASSSPAACIVGPNAVAITTCTTDSATAEQAMANNTTPLNTPSGASQQTSNQALSAYSLFTGPVTSAAAPTAGDAQTTGSYNGSVPVNQANDFTARGFCNTITSVNIPVSPGLPSAAGPGAPMTCPAQTINVPNSLYNSGNVDDAGIIIKAAAQANWTVQLFNDNGSGAPGTPLAGSVAGQNTQGTISVASGKTVTYWAVYTVPTGTNAVTALLQYDTLITATGTAAQGGTVPADVNTTHNDLYAGFVSLYKTVAVGPNGCPSGVTPPAGGVCPGGVLTYTVNVTNIALTNGNEPLPATLYATSGMTISEDGGPLTNPPSTGNTWAAYTNGLNAPAVAAGFPAGSSFTAGNTTGGTTFTYTTGANFLPGTAATITFAVTVK